jgi:hypothetical protein
LDRRDVALGNLDDRTRRPTRQHFEHENRRNSLSGFRLDPRWCRFGLFRCLFARAVQVRDSLFSDTRRGLLAGLWSLDDRRDRAQFGVNSWQN